MCNFIYFSTDGDENVEVLPRELSSVYPWPTERSGELDEVLRFPNRWYLECRYGGCSCHFRHAPYRSPDQGFRVPAVWSANDAESEDEDDIESTQAAYDMFSRWVESGFVVDIFDSNNDQIPAVVETIEVSLSEIGREAFRFLENRRMVLRA
jgi:hypothetical protein